MATVFPDQRLAFAVGEGSDALRHRRGHTITVYADAAGTTLAGVTDMAGAAITGSIVVVGTDSLIPLFQDPTSRDTLYAKPSGSTTLYPIYARTDDRLDALLTAVNDEITTRTADIAGKASTTHTHPTSYAAIVNFPSTVATGQLTPTGIRMDYAVTVGAVMARVWRAPTGSPITVTVRGRVLATGVTRTLGTFTVAAGSKRGLLSGLSEAFAIGDLLFLDVDGVGSTYAGSDIEFSVLDTNATFPGALAAPGLATALTVTPGSTQNTVQWTPPAAGVVSGYDVYRDSGAGYVWLRKVEGATSFVDTGLTNGTSYGYKVAAYNDDIEGSQTSAESGTPAGAGSYNFTFTQADGALPSGLTAVQPTGGTGGVVDVVSNRMRMQSGNAGTDSATDRGRAELSAMPAGVQGIAAQFSYTFEQGAGGIEAYLRVALGSAPSSQSNWVQLQLLSGSYRVADKVSGTFTSRSGTVAKTHNASTKYWAEFKITAAGVIELRLWNDGAAKPGSPTYTFDDSANNATLVANKVMWQILGNSAAGTNCLHYIDDVTVTEL